jgi:hypothetical protein
MKNGKSTMARLIMLATISIILMARKLLAAVAFDNRSR